MSFFREPPAEAERRLAATAATATLQRPEPPPRGSRGDAESGSTDGESGGLPTTTVWRRRDLPGGPGAGAGVPLSEGVSSVFAGAIGFIPVALVSGLAPWNYPVAAVLVIVLSYALWSRRVVVGADYLAVRKFGPYRLALGESLREGGLRTSSRGGVLVLRTADGHDMRLRRVEYTNREVNAGLRALVLSTGRRYDQRVQELLDLPLREDFGHHRYLLDAFD